MSPFLVAGEGRAHPVPFRTMTPVTPARQPRAQARRRLSRAGAVALLLAATTVRALAPAVPIHQYGRDSWGQQHGLSDGVVQGIRQLADDYLWLASSGGLVRFDGVRFVPVPPITDGHPLDESILAVGPAAQGTLIARTRTHTLGLANGRFTELLPPAGLPKGRVRVVRRSDDGRIWIGADNQIYAGGPDGLHLLVEDVSWTNAIAEDGQGRTWFATVTGIYAFAAGRVHYYPALGYSNTPDFHLEHTIDASSVRAGPGSCNALLADGTGGLWVGSLDGLWHLRDGVFEQDAMAAGCGHVSIQALLRDRDGNLWVGTDGAGLWRYAAGRWSTFDSRDGLGDDSALSLAEDKEGSIWVGTRSGLVRFRDTPLQTLTREDGLPADNIWSVVAQRNTVYCSTANAGIVRLRDGDIRTFTTRDGLARDEGGALFAARDGRIWATNDMGLSCLDGERATTFSAGGVLPGVYLPALAEDEHGLILARGDRNLYRYIDDCLQPFAVPMAAATGPDSVRYVWHLHRDRAGTLWMAMSGGLYSLAAGLPPEQARPSACRDLVNSIGEDDRGFLWLAGTETPGFTRLRLADGTLTRFTPAAGANVENIGRILADADGNLWMNTSGGIARFPRAELDAFAEGRASRVSFRLFGVIDGLRTSDCGLIGPQPAAWRADDGRLYFASRKGLVTVDPARLPVNPLVPTVRIEETVVDGRSLPPGPAVTVPPGAERIEFHYTALSLRVPGRVRFRYQLEGFDTDWIEAGTRRTAFFTRLAPGTYRFRVQACNDDGVWNTTGATLALDVRPMFHQTFWFPLLVGLAAAALASLAYVLRTRHLLRHQAELARLVDERTTALREEVVERGVIEQSLREHRDQLEEIIRERTAALQKTNDRLQSEITEHGRSEERLRQAQKLESVGQLAGGVAHDFNNLLTVINGYCDLWLAQPPADDESRAFATEIKRAGEKAASLTQQLLAFSRKQMLQPELVDLNRLVGEMEKMLRRLLREDITLVTHACPASAVIRADPGQISQVVLNLVVNARDAMPAGGTITLETTFLDLGPADRAPRADVPPGPYVQLTVADTGQGMDADILAHLFEPFFTTKELGKGTGLGLSTVFGIVKQSGGHIWVESAPGRGSVFKIAFPRLVGAAPTEAPRPPAPGPAGGGETVLVVEDQSEVRTLVATFLTGHGYRVLQASSGEDALQQCSQYSGPLDVLFTDLVMPGINGRELAERLLAARPGLKVVFATGYTPDTLLPGSLGAEGFVLLRKPFGSATLVEAIRNTLHGSGTGTRGRDRG